MPDRVAHAANVRKTVVIAALVAVSAAVFVFSLSFGVLEVAPGDVARILGGWATGGSATSGDWARNEWIAVVDIRLPRTLAAAACGACLALAGASYQSLFKNPMVSPDILGVTSGASVGASVAILLGGALAWVQAGAFVGGVVAVWLTLTVAGLVRSRSRTVLVLSGIVIGGLASSLMSLVRMLADPETTLADITYWTMGSFARANLGDAARLGPVMLLAVLAMMAFRYRLNVLSLGASEARSLGVNVRAARFAVIALATVLTASCVCLAGPVGWVGLVIPHIARMLAGHDNRSMMPASLFAGAAFMMVIDVLARSMSTTEFPVSVLTGIIGAPFFIVIMVRQRRRLS